MEKRRGEQDEKKESRMILRIAQRALCLLRPSALRSPSPCVCSCAFPRTGRCSVLPRFGLLRVGCFLSLHLQEGEEGGAGRGQQAEEEGKGGGKKKPTVSTVCVCMCVTSTWSCSCHSHTPSSYFIEEQPYLNVT